MKKFLLFLFMLCGSLGYSQQIILLTDTFGSPFSTFVLNDTGNGSNTGANKWVVNNNYNGSPVYPNTSPEDSIVSGTITYAPHSYYMHIYDSTTAQTNSTIAGCEWDPNTPCDRFAVMNNGFCALGLTDVTFTFYWIAGGDTNSYGELYYSSDNGPWRKTGRNKYYNQKYWAYEVVSDTAFNNKANLRFGFRWVNTTGAASTSMSFGIDEVLAVGTYDAVNHPVRIDVVDLSPDSPCVHDYLLIKYKLSQPLCYGNYSIEVLNSRYQWVNANSTPQLTVGTGQDSGYVYIQLDSNLIGNCFHIRIVRVQPAPAIVGDTSFCFSIIRCPTQIYGVSAPVITDRDTTCILSEIDVKFYSSGTFGPSGNTYYAQLSDSNGSFTNPTILGSLPSNQNYPFPPGNISGLIPASVPPGCGYYIRVVSNNPVTVSAPIGPYCLKHCDILSNNITDLHFCIRYPKGMDTAKFQIKINEWNTNASYDTCNNFTVQLLDMNSFAVVNTGGIGIYHATHSDTVLLIVGPFAALPVAPGTYYLRIISNCSSTPANYTGTVIRITIGAPSATPPVIISPQDVYCNTRLVELYINPFNNPPSDYQWISSTLNNGLPFIWPYNPLTINFTGSLVDNYNFRVREINYGCPGPYGAAKQITIVTLPRVHISGPAVVCFGDTAVFYVDFLPGTYYRWTVPPRAHIVAQGNNQVSMTFDTFGTYTISEFSLNDCGSDSGSYKVTISNLLKAKIESNPSLCRGDSIKLSASTFGLNHAFLTIDSGITGKPGAMFNLIAHTDLTIDSFAAKMLIPANYQANILIYKRQGSYIGVEQNAGAWTPVLTTGVSSTRANQMLTFADPVSIQMTAGDTFGFYITTVDVPHTVMAFSPPGAPPFQGVVYKSDRSLDFVQGSANDLDAGDNPFGPFIGPRVWNGIIYYHSKAGLHYLWNTGDTAPVINPMPTTDTKYLVKIFDITGCNALDSVLIHVSAKPTLSVGPDSFICDGLSYVVPGVASVSNIIWQPSTGLDNPNIINPTFHYSDSVSYLIIARDTAAGCADSTHLKLGVLNCTSYIHVADAFSPNGNTTNDHFTLFANKIAEYTIRIYNRWGELVYESSDLTALNDLSKGWDGTYKGQPQNAGTFVYHLSATDEYTKKITKSGNITLLR